jgi:hypothetical protein
VRSDCSGSGNSSAVATCPKGDNLLERPGRDFQLWAEVRREAGRGKDRFKIRDLFADERCGQPILDFLSTRIG